MSYIRKKPSQGSGGYGGGQQRNNKSRFSHSGGGGGHHNNNNGGRARKNYGSMKEKYLAQARDALASGDRVLAENYFQYADHCFRMLAEENASRVQRSQNNQQTQQSQQKPQAAEASTAQATQSAEIAPESKPEGDNAAAPANVSASPDSVVENNKPVKKDVEPTATPNSKEE